MADRARVWWWVSLTLRIALLVLAAWALRRELSDLDARDLAIQLHSYGWRHVSLGLLATAASFLTLGVIELLGLRYARRVVPWRVGMTTGFVANALSQSIGVALLTGASVRLRAYARYTVGAIDVARISAFVTLTVTLGLLATGAVAFLASSAPLQIAHLVLPVRVVGAVMGGLVMAYVAWSAVGSAVGTHDAFIGGRWSIVRPSLALALQQIALSSLDWLLTGSILYLLLPRALGIEYATLLRVFLVAQTVGTLSHVPGGAGVFELLVLTLLATVTMPVQHTAIVASLLMFRAFYYLIPLIAASLVAGIAELRSIHTSGHPRHVS